jgi:hypothetical protein
MKKTFNGNPNNNFFPHNIRQNNNYPHTQNKEIMGYHNYQNDNHFIHNNIDTVMLKNIIQEYKVNIDTGYRNTTTYLNQFNTTVTFNPKNDPEPHILIDFKNVKFIRIDKIILPSYKSMIKKEPSVENITIIEQTREGESIEVDVDVLIYKPIREENNYTSNDLITSTDIQNKLTALGYTDVGYVIYDNNNNQYFYEDNKWYIYEGDIISSLLDDDYIILNIPELNTHTYGTNNHVNGAFSILFPDKQISNFKYNTEIMTNTFEFKDSNLGNIKKLTFQFLDIYGNILKFDHLDNTITNKKDTRHPLNSSLQIQICMVIGVIEPTQNKLVQY